jgi:hypothetical protein
MSRLDDLPPDQHAALGLLLRQHKSYAEVAELLGIRQLAIHDRVHAALAVLAPQQARMLTAPRREEVGNFLLGQEPDEQRREATRAFLASSDDGRAWAEAIARELLPLSDRPLGEIPVPGEPFASQAEPETHEFAPETRAPQAIGGEAGTGAEPATESPPGDDSGGAAERPAAVRPERPRGRGRPPRRREPPARDPGQWSGVPALEARTSRSSSRRAGALLLGLIVVAVIVAVVLIASGGGSHSEPAKTTAAVSSSASAATSSQAAKTSSATSATHTTTSTATSGPKTENRITLTPRKAGSDASAIVEILSEDGKEAFYISAKNLPPSNGFFYAVWLYNSPTESRGLGRAPSVGSKGTLEGGLLLPSDAGKYHEMLLTQETTTTPTEPGPVVLSGPFSLH